MCWYNTQDMEALDSTPVPYPDYIANPVSFHYVYLVDLQDNEKQRWLYF